MNEFCQFILAKLTPFAPIATKKMFGEICLFRHGNMFAIISNDVLYLKATDHTKPLFVEAGCEPFTYMTTRAGIKKQVALNYWSLPENALDDDDEFDDWIKRVLD